MTQLPAAGQLAGNPRRLVQQPISDFNAMLTINAAWRASYNKVDSTLDNLLEPSVPAPASGTNGAVGRAAPSLAADAINPAIRAKLVEFRGHLEQFERALSEGNSVASSSGAPTPAATSAPASPTPGPPLTTPPAAPAAIGDRPDSPPAPTRDPRATQEFSVVARDVLLHLEAVEVILSPQAAAQKASTEAAGGAVVSTQTASGSTRTTVNGTKRHAQRGTAQNRIETHLKDIRLLLERK